MENQDGLPVERVDEHTFEAVFKDHFKSLHTYANVILKDSDEAEEIVQTVFLKLWEKRGMIKINTSLKAYLYKSVYYDSLNHIKHQKVKMKHREQKQYETTQNGSVEAVDVMEGQDEELNSRFQQALRLLPEKCRTVFHLSRFEELKYQEIAQKMGISIKTVEAHMGKALKTLRLELAEFLPLILMLIIEH
ncbi:RNA polymerase sigma-70 factor [Negadavirga shengliensis]|uniref:RNA polymerase sigma-70 factor n=1 Tax=Negadavirga shengliensis TaxID=1389218 RepID=A0ABV9T0S7_9BACT